MSESRLKYYKGLFLLVAVYDIILGIIFMFFTKSTFEFLGIPEKLPEFDGYLTLIGVYVLILGIAYYLIYKGDLQKNRDLILIGVLYKLGYCAVTFYYFIIGDIPHVLFLALFGVIDFIMFILMLECYYSIGKKEPA
ncbi:MAG: hypothetical protein A3F91_10280 [Flavobacteria bacterium RIFCSPLOWO2_12_FULL_35_11]|nr:MAG: hypothetical protein A3F91_10280 [Flavobacteria bacterium RIFCSPLOWO2_12_FULL_35_11]